MWRSQTNELSGSRVGCPEVGSADQESGRMTRSWVGLGNQNSGQVTKSRFKRVSNGRVLFKDERLPLNTGAFLVLHDLLPFLVNVEQN